MEKTDEEMLHATTNFFGLRTGEKNERAKHRQVNALKVSFFPVA
jgi:hypothetical protein